MSQQDFTIDNQLCPPFRAELNLSLKALASNNAGLLEPATKFAYQFWYDTTTNILKMRNSTNSGWIPMFTFDQALGTWSISSLIVSGDLTLNKLVAASTVSGTNVSATGALSNRNMIINGAMQVAQRGTSLSGITTEQFGAVDRWSFAVNSLGTWTLSKNSDAPQGFKHSLKAVCTIGNAASGAADYSALQYKIEGQDLDRLEYGKATAQKCTLSFWVKSNKTGAASVNLLQFDNAYKQVCPSYTINSAHTWEKKTIAIEGDPNGIINSDNGIGLRLSFWLNGGSNTTGGVNNTAWGAQIFPNQNASNLGVGGTTNDYFAISGVQLELGETATPFEHRSYDYELLRCQRYFWKQIRDNSAGTVPGNGHWLNSTMAFIQLRFPRPMRAPPTITHSTIADFQILNPGVAWHNLTGISALATLQSAELLCVVASTTGTIGHGSSFKFNQASASIQYSAEL